MFNDEQLKRNPGPRNPLGAPLRIALRIPLKEPVKDPLKQPFKEPLKEPLGGGGGHCRIVLGLLALVGFRVLKGVVSELLLGVSDKNDP